MSIPFHQALYWEKLLLLWSAWTGDHQLEWRPQLEPGLQGGHHGAQPSCKAQRYGRSGYKNLCYTRRQLDSLLGQSQRQVNWNFGHSTPFSILFQSIQADICKYEFHENFILMLFSLCKVIPSILTSCLMSSFFSEMPSCENVEKNKSCPLPPYAVSSEASSSSNLALRRHSLYGETMSWLLRDLNKLKESERDLKIF